MAELILDEREVVIPFSQGERRSRRTSGTSFAIYCRSSAIYSNFILFFYLSDVKFHFMKRPREGIFLAYFKFNDIFRHLRNILVVFLFNYSWGHFFR